jgi:hypothetical protein
MAATLSLLEADTQARVPPRGVYNYVSVESVRPPTKQFKGFNAAWDAFLEQTALYCEPFKTRRPDFASAVKQDLIKTGATDAGGELAFDRDCSDRSANLASAGGGQTQVGDLRSL